MWTWRTTFGFERPTISRGLLVLALMTALAGAGCGSRRGTDLLEARLRDQEDQLAEMQRKLDVVAAERDSRTREIDDLRGRLSQRGAALPVPEQSEALFRVTGIGINTLLSGGADTDDQPGDDSLSVMITPQDEQGDIVKLPGYVEMSAYDMSLPDSEQNLGTWAFDVEQVRKQWHGGFTGSGFLLQVPLRGNVDSNEILLHVRFTTIDGRQFDKTESLRFDPEARPRPRSTLSGDDPQPLIPASGRKPENIDATGRVKLLDDRDDPFE